MNEALELSSQCKTEQLLELDLHAEAENHILYVTCCYLKLYKPRWAERN